MSRSDAIWARRVSCSYSQSNKSVNAMFQPRSRPQIALPRSAVAGPVQPMSKKKKTKVFGHVLTPLATTLSAKAEDTKQKIKPAFA